MWYKDINSHEWKRRQIHVWYLGDDDKYGRDMDRHIKEQLEFLGY